MILSLSWPVTNLVETAARNNAEWCDIVCRAHGLTGVLAADAWTCQWRTPPLYPDAVTLSADAVAERILDRVDRRPPGCSIKDSFATLDLRAAGFRIRFDATWIMRLPPRPDPSVTWSVVDAEIAHPEVLTVAGDACGVTLNCSASVVGASNLTAEDGDLDRAWTVALAAAAERFPGVAVLGYESGDALAAALVAGFEAIGSLRVWLAE